MKNPTTRAKTETSAGGIIVSKVGAGWWVLLMKDRGGNWTFPKGKIEKGETHRAAAVREIQEEVHIDGLSYVATLTPNKYYYFRDGSIKKTVHFFLYMSPTRAVPVVQTEEGITEACWVPFAQAMTLIGYPTSNRPLLSEVDKILRTLS